MLTGPPRPGYATRRKPACRVLAGAVLSLLATTCGPGAEVKQRAGGASRSRLGLRTSVLTTLRQEGEVAYARYCVGCHGPEGDGLGEAAKFFRIKPRNFVQADFKFSWTRSGQLPTDADLKRTIREGLRGSAMPPFDLLAERTLDALLAYIKTFSPKWAQRGAGTPIPIVEDPYRGEADKSEAIARGEAVYHGFATCWNCHPAYVSQEKLNGHLVAFGSLPREAFRDGLTEAVGKKNALGAIVHPPAFRRDFVRGGTDVDDLYRAIGAGVTGTAMPTWIDSMDLPGETADAPPLVQPSDIWAMAYYTRELIKQRPALLEPGTFQVRHRPAGIYLHGEPPATPAGQAPGEAEEEFVEEDEEEFFEDEE